MSDDTERRYFALASDGDIIEDVSREEAFAWMDEHLAMLESLEPTTEHWVQVNSRPPEESDE